jgi:hypothetical protein
VKENPPRYPIQALVGKPIKFPVCELKAVATGFMRITRECLKRTLAKYPDGKLFNHYHNGHEEQGDDMAFCHRVRSAGGTVWGKFDIEFEHVGPYSWKGTACVHMAKEEGFTLGEHHPDAERTRIAV